MYMYGISREKSTFEMNTDLDDVKILRRELYLDYIFICIFLWIFYSLDRDQVPACVWFNPIKWLQVFHSDFHGSCLSTSARGKSCHLDSSEGGGRYPEQLLQVIHAGE